MNASTPLPAEKSADSNVAPRPKLPCEMSGAEMLRFTNLKGVLGLEQCSAERFCAVVKTVGDEEVHSLLLSHSQVGNPELRLLLGLPTLKFINLCHTEVGDEGIAALSGHPSLAELQLTGTQVTDACFASLACLPELRKVTLYKTKISEEALQKFLAGKRFVEANAYFG